MTMAKLLFPASVVGSMPRSLFIQDLINDKPPLPLERYEAEMDAAIRYIVAVQEHAGVDVITDGEWRRKSYIGVIAELAHGFELSLNPQDGRPWTVVVDKLAPKRPGFIAREISFLRTITSRKIKATLPAPALLGERMWHPEKSAKAYPERDGNSRPLDSRSGGLVAGEGAGFVALRRYADAVRDGDDVYAVIRGIGLSNDGNGKHLLVPNQGGQRTAMERAYRAAGVPPASIAYVECHATGTPLGDATELDSMEARVANVNAASAHRPDHLATDDAAA